MRTVSPFFGSFSCPSPLPQSFLGRIALCVALYACGSHQEARRSPELLSVDERGMDEGTANEGVEQSINASEADLLDGPQSQGVEVEGASTGLRSHDQATPTTLRIINGRQTPIRFSATFGAGSPFQIMPRSDLPNYSLGGSGDLDAVTCACRCGTECVTCQPPQQRTFDLAPGQTHDYAWSGRVRVSQPTCFEPHAAPHGPSVFRACAYVGPGSNQDCVEVQARLPVDDVELVFR